MLELQMIQQLQEEIRELKKSMEEQQSRIAKLEQKTIKKATVEATVYEAAPLHMKQKTSETNEFFSEDTFWGEIPIQIDEVVPKVKDFAKESHVLSRSLEDTSGRHKFLIGKQIGSDLIDATGNLIALENTIITPELIDKAREKGMLAYLIVNMKLPD